MNKEKLKVTLSKKQTKPDLLDEIEEKLETEIEDALSPQPSLVPITLKEPSGKE